MTIMMIVSSSRRGVKGGGSANKTFLFQAFYIPSALALIATADVEVKGMSALEPTLVLEILVARLARLGGRTGRR